MLVCLPGLLGMAAPATAAAGPAAGVEVAPPVTAAGAVVWDPADERPLWEREADVPRAMASTTKIMTALVALEHGTVDDEVAVSEAAAGADAGAGAASLGLRPGQRVPMRSLIAGLVVRSGNDAAVAVAEHVAGSEAAFVARMNARAAELGLRETSFVDASGLTTDPAHQASPRDLARLAAVAMAHPEFARWAGASQVVAPGLPGLENRNELLGRYPGATGVKTGYTARAGQCLVASATRDGRTLYAVVLGSRDSFGDATSLLDLGFNGFRRAAPLVAGGTGAVYRWADASIPVVAADTLARTVPADSRVEWRVRLRSAARRPVQAGSVLGEAELLVDGRVVKAVDLRAAARVAPPSLDASPATRAGVALHDAIRAFARLEPPARAVQ
jgi:D-alanyl-D-alanine carboxypeptidase (penicillin-binding protein 5/6)